MAELGEAQVKDGLQLYKDAPESSLAYQDAIEDAQYFLDGNGDMPPLSGAKLIEGLVIPARSHFGYWIMHTGEERPHALDLAQRVTVFVMSIQRHQFLTNPDHLTPELARYGEILLELIATGRADLLPTTEQIARSVLESGRYVPPEGSTGYFVQPSKIGVFALEMLAQYRGETIDWESFHVPPDRFWLDAARLGMHEPDPDKGAQWARELCDAHMRTLATDTENYSMDPTTGHEIRNEAHFLWPIGTVAFLRMRRALGLTTAAIDHPLMRTSFQVLHDWQVPAGSWPGAPWWSDILDRTAAIAPELSEQIEVVR